jgi:hypothetical protein
MNWNGKAKEKRRGITPNIMRFCSSQNEGIIGRECLIIH